MASSQPLPIFALLLLEPPQAMMGQKFPAKNWDTSFCTKSRKWWKMARVIEGMPPDSANEDARTMGDGGCQQPSAPQTRTNPRKR